MSEIKVNETMELSVEELDNVAGGKIITSKLAVSKTDFEAVSGSVAAGKGFAFADEVAINDESEDLAATQTIVD